MCARTVINYRIFYYNGIFVILQLVMLVSGNLYIVTDKLHIVKHGYNNVLCNDIGHLASINKSTTLVHRHELQSNGGANTSNHITTVESTS